MPDASQTPKKIITRPKHTTPRHFLKTEFHFLQYNMRIRQRRHNTKILDENANMRSFTSARGIRKWELSQTHKTHTINAQFMYLWVGGGSESKKQADGWLRQQHEGTRHKKNFFFFHILRLNSVALNLNCLHWRSQRNFPQKYQITERRLLWRSRAVQKKSMIKKIRVEIAIKKRKKKKRYFESLTQKIIKKYLRFARGIEHCLIFICS